MSILDVPPPSAPFAILLAEHPRHPIRRFKPPGRVTWVRITPDPHVRFELLRGYKTEGAVVVTFHF